MKKRTELPNYFKLDHITVDVEKLLACFEGWEHEQDTISAEYGDPYLNDLYLQCPVTTYSELKMLNSKLIDEKCYDTLLPQYKGTYVEEVLSMFKSRPTRVRLIVKKSGAMIKPHIDYDTTYSVRYFIPLKTNPWAFTALKGKHDSSPEVVHLEADGSVYFVNQGNQHAAWNAGFEDDIRLIVACDGQDDLCM